MEYAARDLVDWMEAASPELRPSDRARESSPGPKSMIQQINDILQDEIAGSPTEKTRYSSDGIGGWFSKSITRGAKLRAG